MTGQSCTACGEGNHNRRSCPRVYGPRRPYTLPISNPETQALREDMQLSFDFREPRPPGEVFAELRAQWGQLGERRLQRILRRLECERVVVAIGIRYSNGVRCGSDGYVRRAA